MNGPWGLRLGDATEDRKVYGRTRACEPPADESGGGEDLKMLLPNGAEGRSPPTVGTALSDSTETRRCRAAYRILPEIWLSFRFFDPVLGRSYGTEWQLVHQQRKRSRDGNGLDRFR